MLRQWVRVRSSLAATTLGGVLVVALVAAAAIVSTGYTAQRLDLSDASVWVASGSRQAVGRVNTEVQELNSVMPDVGADLELVQSGPTVFLLNREDATLGIVDPATSVISDSVPLPPDDPEVFLAGDTVTVIARGSGEVWFVPVATVGEFDAEAAPDLSLGAGLVASVDDEGRLFVYSRAAKQVYSLTPALSSEVQSADPLEVSGGDAVSISSVAGNWAVLDSVASRLHLPERSVPIAVTGTAALQAPSSTGDSVIVADSAGLTSIPIATGDPVSEATGQGGTPARPVVVGGCVFAAWTGGNAWRSCAKTAGTLLPLEAMPADGELHFRTNGDRVLLNDSLVGGSWAVQSSGELIDNWVDLIPPEDAEREVDTNADTPPDLAALQLPPVAADDDLGARPGRANVLPVLLNDYDPNGDVVVLSDVPTIDESLGRIDLVNERQQLQLTLADSATGVLSIRYSIDDGRGGSASATVTITIRGAGENSAPKQARSTRSETTAGGRLTTQVLGDWVDPDGDAFYLAGATVRAPDSVSSRPQGVVVFDSAAGGAASASVALTVSDGTDTGVGALAVTVLASGALPMVADAFIVLAISGQEVTISPLDHVRGGTGAVRLNNVPARPGTTIVPSYDTGTFRFTGTTAATYYLDYVVTDGDQTVTGAVRVDVAPAGMASRPVTTPKTVFVQTLSSESIDVAGTDVDPAGGVLLVTALTDVPRGAGVSAEVLEQRLVRVRLDAPLAAPVSFHYTVSNGQASADGIITVIEIPVPPNLQPPIATDDEITVRAGATIDIPVLVNDEQPDGAALSLLPVLPQDLPEGAGLLFASGTVLRYLAPQATGNFLAVYEIEGPDGQRARAQLRISVRESDVDTNSAPAPQTLTARALAGETVTIPVVLSGIDPDGDTVLLLGQETNPEKGSVVEVGPDSITYRAGDYSAGTDTFDYAVIDALGARATGTVRIGISARQDGARNPVATIDEVATRPNTTLSVQVLANDSDPDGSALSVLSAVPNDPETTATVSGDLVVVRPPNRSGVYGVVYTIENESGGTSSNFIRIEVDPEAPLSYPVVSDTVLTLSDIEGRDEVNVDVLGNVFFADGKASSLRLQLAPGFADVARITASQRVRVQLVDDSQIIPFRVTHPDDATVFSYGFIRVPGFNDALPQLDRTAPALRVTSGDSLVIDLADHVLAEGGKQVILTDTSSVRATNSNGDDLVVDRDTLVFRSADRYFGTASISFEVTDGSTPSDADGRTATLVLPITVLPRDNQPPVFGGAILEFEPGEAKEIDLSRLTVYPADDTDELEFSALDDPVGFSARLNRGKLTLTAGETTATGSTASISIGVRDTRSEGRSGRIQLSVVPSTRPLARAATDTAVVRRGETTGVDVLANDQATNPFPETPLRVVAIRGIDSAVLPDGVRVTPGADRRNLAVTVAASAAAQDVTLQYQVTDATGDPFRSVWGTVRVSVQDRPDAVSAVRVTEYVDRGLTVAWNTAASNNSPITGYRVVLSDAASGAVVGTTDCGGAQCRVATPGNGSEFAVRIAVTALNSIGASDPSPVSAPVWSDVIPAAPAGLAGAPLDHGLRVSWRKPANDGGGTAITSYVVSVDGAAPVEVTVSADDAVGTEYSRSVTAAGIANGSSVGFSVSARNQATASATGWNRASGTGSPAGAPQAAAAPRASVNADDPGSAALSWSGGFSDNGRAVTEYFAAVFTGQAPSCSVEGTLPGSVVVPGDSATFQHLGAATSTRFSGLSANIQYSFAVYAFNGMGCTVSSTVTAIPRFRPGTVTGTSITGPELSSDWRWDYRLAAFDIASGSTDADAFRYRLSGDFAAAEVGPVRVDSSSFLRSATNSHFGRAVTLEVMACKSYPEYPQALCSANWSAPERLGVPVEHTPLGSLKFTPDAPTEEQPVPLTGRYTWLASPVGEYDSVTFDCGNDTETLRDGEGGTCAVALGAIPVPVLTVTIRANGTTYERTYNGNDYD